MLMARKTSIVLLLTALVFTIILWRNARRFDPQLKETLAEVQWELADMYGTGEDAARSQLHPEPEPTVSIPDKIDPASLSKQIVMTRRLSDNVDWVEEEFKE